MSLSTSTSKAANPDAKNSNLVLTFPTSKKNIFYPGRWFRRTDTVGTGRKDAEKSPYLAGKHGKALETGSSIPVGSYRIFFLWIPVSFLCFPVSFLCFTSGSWSESTGKKSGNFQLEYCFHFPALSCAFRPFPAVRPRPGFVQNSENLGFLKKQFSRKPEISFWIPTHLMFFDTPDISLSNGENHSSLSSS